VSDHAQAKRPLSGREVLDLVIEYLESDKPYNRAKTEFELPTHMPTAYAANQELKWSQPHTFEELAVYFRRLDIGDEES
jgi:hypothetical protein